MISHHQWKDNSLMSYQNFFQPGWTKKFVAKKRMPIYGIIDIFRAILAPNVANYQHFSMRPGSFDKYHQITYKLYM